MKTAFKYVITLFILLTSTMTTLYAANLTARVDRQTLSKDATLTLTVTTDQNTDASPNFDVLKKDFQIVSLYKKNAVTLVNSQITRLSSWRLTLIPKKTGAVIIPQLTLGTLQTHPITLTVSRTAHTNPNTLGSGIRTAFIEVSASPVNAYVQSQVLYKMSIYYSASLLNAKLIPPRADNAIVKPLAKPKRYNVQRAGRWYQVMEQDFLITPQKSGKMVIASPSLTAEMFTGQLANSSSLLPSGLLDPMGAKPIRLTGREITLRVKPIPSSYPAAAWLPASHLSLTEQWSSDPTQGKVGDPITRTVTLSANGLSASQLPSPSQPTTNQLKAYADKPQRQENTQGKNISSQRTDKIAIIPTTSGKIIIPAIEIPWWNTTLNKLEIARLPEKTITAAANSNMMNTVKHPLLEQNTNLATLPGTQATTEISRKTQSTTALTHLAQSNRLPWMLTILFAGLWLLTFFYRRYNSPLQTSSHVRPTLVDSAAPLKLAQLKKQIQQACLHNDPAATKRLLTPWCQHHNINSVGELQKHTEDVDFLEQLNILQTVLYGQPQQTWQGDMFWDRFKKVTLTSAKTQSRKGNELPDFYKI